MRDISETFQIPPFIGERFRDVESVVEFKIFDKIDETIGLDPCDYCYYNTGDTCDGGVCTQCFEKRDDYCPDYKNGYYVKIGGIPQF